MQGAELRARELEIVLPGGDGVGPWSGTIEPGEAVLIIAPSGAGKSTLLRALAGAIPQHVRAHVTGSLEIFTAGGRIDPVAGGVAATAGAVGFVGQDPAAGVAMRIVADEIALPLESRGVAPALIGQAITLALGAVGAAHLQDRDAAALSGGELQRVALAAALVAEPGVLLLDEPTAMLDGEGIAAVREALRVVPADVTTVLVEHRLDEWTAGEGVEGLPSRTIALDRSGRVRADGPTDLVLREHGRALLEEGCWVPAQTELALLPELARRLEEGTAALDPAASRDSAPLHGPVGAGRVAAASEAGEAPRMQGAPAAEVMLQARAVTAGWGETPVLQGVDLELRAGEITAVIGRNGAGKSTLLTLLAGLLDPWEGEVSGERTGLAFQNPEHQFLMPTVIEEIALGDPAGAGEALERLGLADLAGRSPFSLSGGQKRRLSLAAMLAHGRRVLLADEPTFGLDRASTHEVLAMLREAADGGAAVLMTCHDLRTIAQCADRALLLENGRLHALPRGGTPEALTADPSIPARAGMSVPPLLTRILGAGLPLRETLFALASPGVAPEIPGPVSSRDGAAELPVAKGRREGAAR